MIGPPLAALIVAQSFEALFIIDGAMTLAVRFAVAPLLPPNEPAARPAETRPPACCARSAQTGPC